MSYCSLSPRSVPTEKVADLISLLVELDSSYRKVESSQTFATAEPVSIGEQLQLKFNGKQTIGLKEILDSHNHSSQIGILASQIKKLAQSFENDRLRRADSVGLSHSTIDSMVEISKIFRQIKAGVESIGMIFDENIRNPLARHDSPAFARIFNNKDFTCENYPQAVMAVSLGACMHPQFLEFYQEFSKYRDVLLEFDSKVLKLPELVSTTAIDEAGKLQRSSHACLCAEVVTLLSKDVFTSHWKAFHKGSSGSEAVLRSLVQIPDDLDFLAS